MDLGISGKIAFVGGGSKGMGLATARLLAADGCRVAIVAREQSAIDTAVAELIEQGRSAVGISADLATRDGVDEAVAKTTEAFGAPDIAFGLNNDVNFARFADSTPEVFEEVFRTLTVSQIHLAKATIPAMQDKKWGRFIHVGSLVAKEPQLVHPHIYHNTIRPSTVAFLRTLAHEVAADGVTVNAIGPGWIRTPQFDWYTANVMGFTETETAAWLAGEIPFPHSGGKQFLDIPMRRAGKMEELGGVAAFLASELGGYITGHWFAVDGGRHAFSF